MSNCMITRKNGTDLKNLQLQNLSYDSGYQTGTTKRTYTFTLSEPIDLVIVNSSLGVGNDGAYGSATSKVNLYADDTLLGTSTGTRGAHGMYYHKIKGNFSSNPIKNVRTIKVEYSSSDNECNMKYDIDIVTI